MSFSCRIAVCCSLHYVRSGFLNAIILVISLLYVSEYWRCIVHRQYSETEHCTHSSRTIRLMFMLIIGGSYEFLMKNCMLPGFSLSSLSSIQTIFFFLFLDAFGGRICVYGLWQVPSIFRSVQPKFLTKKF